jgi:hypothetical protein
MANGMFKIKIDINRHGPRLMPSNCKHLDPPYFSLQTTFKLIRVSVRNSAIQIRYAEVFISLLKPD